MMPSVFVTTTEIILALGNWAVAMVESENVRISTMLPGVASKVISYCGELIDVSTPTAGGLPNGSDCLLAPRGEVDGTGGMP